MSAKYDLIVIGAGSGGLVVATTANRRGLKVAMLEKNKIGGECTHSGCVPSKALIQSAKQYYALRETSKYGLPKMKHQAVNFAELMQHVDEVVQGIYEHETPEVWVNQGIDVYVHPAGAQFLDSHSLSIGPDILEADHFVICTGSSPRTLEVPGSENVPLLDNENFWALREQPASIVFIGGGVISAELGQSLSRFGSGVTIVEQNDRILKMLDPEVNEVIEAEFESLGIRCLRNTILKSMRREGTETVLELETEGQIEELRTEAVFVAIGRSPHVHGMDLEKAGVRYSDKGIQVNEYLQSTASHIYACGDVASRAKFTHVAAYQAVVCVDNIQHGNHRENDLSILPWAIFTEPEIAHVGISEAKARAEYGQGVQTFKVNAMVDRFITDRKTGGFLKVVFGPDGKVLGADGIGAHAGEWTQLLTPVMKYNLPLEEFVYTIYSYPTYSEIVKKAITRYLRTQNS